MQMKTVGEKIVIQQYLEKYISGNCNIPQNSHLTNFLLVKISGICYIILSQVHIIYVINALQP